VLFKGSYINAKGNSNKNIEIESSECDCSHSLIFTYSESDFCKDLRKKRPLGAETYPTGKKFAAEWSVTTNTA
jgi:hypothetical protein